MFTILSIKLEDPKDGLFGSRDVIRKNLRLVLTFLVLMSKVSISKIITFTICILPLRGHIDPLNDVDS